MSKYLLMIGLAIGLMGTGCATSKKSALLGAGIGAGVGGIAGTAIDPGENGRGRIKNAFVGASIGSLLGAGVGYLAHSDKEADPSAQKARPQGTSSGVGEAPNLVPPKVEARYVDDQIRGNIYVPGHFEYVIVEPARWVR